VALPVVEEEVGASYPEVVREEGPEVVREGEVASFPVVAVEEVASFPVVVGEVASSGDRPLAIAAAGRIRRD
jgi:hypothetical protein